MWRNKISRRRFTPKKVPWLVKKFLTRAPSTRVLNMSSQITEKLRWKFKKILFDYVFFIIISKKLLK